MRLLLSSYSFFIKAPSAAVCKALISLVFYYHPYQSLANTRFLGYLTFGHKLSCDNKSIFRLYYSMIVATRPDPTVRPPSRYQNGVLQRLNGYFSFILCGKIRIFRCVRVVFKDFVIMMLSHY